MDKETPKIPIAKHASQPARRMTTALRNSWNHSSAPPAPGAHEEVGWNRLQTPPIGASPIVDYNREVQCHRINSGDVNNNLLCVDRFEAVIRLVLERLDRIERNCAPVHLVPRASPVPKNLIPAPVIVHIPQMPPIRRVKIRAKSSPPEVGRHVEETDCAAAQVPAPSKNKGRRSIQSDCPTRWNTARIFSLKKGVKRCYRGKLLLVPAQKSFLGNDDLIKFQSQPSETAPEKLVRSTLLLLRRLAVECMVPD